MSKFLFCILFILSGQLLFCQTWKQRMLQQIAANKVYIEYLEKGYRVVKGGLETIRDIRNGDFKLHFTYFDSLKKVNPSVKNYVRVAGIIGYQVRIIKGMSKTMAAIRQQQIFTNQELDYCKAVFDNLLDDCLESINELILVITDGELSMKDDERLKRIDKIYDDMQDKYSFASSFSEETGILAAQRLSEQVEVNMSENLNSIR